MIYLYIALAVLFGVLFIVGGAREEISKFNGTAEAHKLWLEAE